MLAHALAPWRQARSVWRRGSSCVRRLTFSAAETDTDALRLVFFGTDEVSLPTLKKIHQAALDGTCDSHGRRICSDSLLVVCPPDVRKGRKRVLQPVPVKQYCLDHGIPVVHPPSRSSSDSDAGSVPTDNESNLQRWIPNDAGVFDVGVVVSFGYMIPEEVLLRSIGPYGAINLHPSLLPRYRGAAPVPRCLLNGDKETGTSIIRVTAKKFDSGDVLLQRTYSLESVDATHGQGQGEGRGGGGGPADDCADLGNLVASELLLVLADRGSEDIMTVLLDLDEHLKQAR